MKTTHPSVIRRDELLALILEGSTDEKVFADLRKLNEADKSSKKAWSDSIQSIIEMMTRSEPTIGIVDLINASPSLRPVMEAVYDSDAFIAGAKAYRLSTVKTANGRVPTNNVGNSTKSKALGIAVLVIKVPGAKGQATTIYQHSPLPAETSDVNKFKNSFAYVKNMDGDIGVNLRKFVGANLGEVQNFLISPDGDMFIAKWAGWISRGGKRK